MQKVDGPFYLVELDDAEIIAQNKTEKCEPWIEYSYKKSVILGCECEEHHCDCKVVGRYGYRKFAEEEPKVVENKVVLPDAPPKKKSTRRKK